MWVPREKQKMPPQFYIWMILAGRGFGKTKTGAESIVDLIVSHNAKNIGLIGQTIKETQNVMVEGCSGIFSSAKIPAYHYNKSQGIITFKDYKAKIYLLGGDAPEKLRGPQFDTVWIDEFAKFQNPKELWAQIELSLRMSKNPRCIITTTPRPIPLLHQLLERDDVVLTQGSTFENEENLSAVFVKTIKERYENTRWGAQELWGTLFAEAEGALFKKSFFQYATYTPLNCKRVVIGLDPAVSKNGCETGIIVCGLTQDRKAFVMDDLSGHYSPCEWVAKIKEAYVHYVPHRIIVETNQGGSMIEQLFFVHGGLRLPIKEVFAKRNKISRAEPIIALYEKGFVYHTQHFQKLEDQMMDYRVGRPADRIDALVWALTDLFYEEERVCEWF